MVGPLSIIWYLGRADIQIPASSAPQRSQYHSVGRLRVPHSPHLSVLATPAAPGLPGADGCTAAPPDSEDRPAVWAGLDPGLLARRGGGAGFRSSSETDLRNASSSLGGAGSGSRGRGGLGTERGSGRTEVAG